MANKKPSDPALEKILKSLDQIHSSLDKLTTTSTITDKSDLYNHALKRLANAIESYDKSASHPQDAREYSKRLDTLEAAGVRLWNRARDLRTTGTPYSKVDIMLEATIRKMALGLCEMGTPGFDDPETILRFLTLCTKTAQACIANDDTTAAQEYLSKAASFDADYKQHLETSPDQFRFTSQYSQAQLSFLLCRADLAALQDSQPICRLVISEILQEASTGEYGITDIERILNKLYTFAKDAWSKTPKQVEQALEWLEMAARLLDQYSHRALHAIKNAILRLNAHVLNQDPLSADSATKLTAILNELIELEPENAKLRVRLCFVVAKGPSIALEDIETTFISAFSVVPMDNTNVQRLLQALHKITKYADLKHALYIKLLETVMENAAQQDVQALTALSLAVAVKSPQCTKREQVQKLLDVAEKGCKDNGVIIPQGEAFFCQSKLWETADKCHDVQSYHEAAEWLLLATHPAFAVNQDLNFDRCIRKATLFYLHAEENELASRVLPKLGQTASDCYIKFLFHARQNDEAKALHYMNELCKAKDFKIDMLLHVASQAYELDFRKVLIKAFTTILSLSENSAGMFSFEKIMIIFRCTIRLLCAQILQDGQDEALADVSSDMLDQVIRYSQAALAMFRSALSADTTEVISKETVWMCKNLLRLAKDDIQISLDRMIAINDIVAEAIEFIHSLKQDSGEQLSLALLAAVRYAALSITVLALRDEDQPDSKGCKAALGRIATLRKLLQAHADAIPDHETMLATSATYEFELNLVIEAWDEAKKCIERLPKVPSDQLLDTMGELVYRAKCPPEFSSHVLQHIFQCQMAAGSVNLKKYAKWLRAIFDHAQENQLTSLALAIAQQALQASTENEGYPEVELNYLSSKCWAFGCRMFPLVTDEGKLWCELAMSLLKSSEHQLAEMHGFYATLLEKYTVPESDSSQL